jgi:hypothetical protein
MFAAEEVGDLFIVVVKIVLKPKQNLVSVGAVCWASVEGTDAIRLRNRPIGSP